MLLHVGQTVVALEEVLELAYYGKMMVWVLQSSIAFSA
jgi:hypothetical protein